MKTIYYVYSSDELIEATVAAWMSVEHWLDNWQRSKRYEWFSINSDNCALCNAFINGDCVLCPIYLLTGKELCEGSPYDEVSMLIPETMGEVLTYAVQEEYLFLVEIALALSEELEHRLANDLEEILKYL